MKPLSTAWFCPVVAVVMFAATLAAGHAFAQGAMLDVTPSGTAPAGGTITVKWSGPNGPGDFITVVRQGAGPSNYLDYKGTGGRTPVNPVSLVLPADTGAHEIRYVRGNPRTVLATVPYTVTAVTATVDAPASVVAGARFEVAWQGPNGRNDWVTIVASSAAARTYGSYVDAQNGRANENTNRRTATLQAPKDPGRYELRYVQQGTQVIGMRPIEVRAATSGALVTTATSAPSAAPAAIARPAAPISTAPPAAPPPAPTGPTVRIEIYAHFINDSTTSNLEWLPLNGAARYVVGVDNTPPSNGTGAADGTMLKIPATSGFSKTAVVCTAHNGAQCPAGLTVAQLESGVAIPRLPAFSDVRIALDARVTGTLGSTVSMTATITAPPNTRDTIAFDDTVTKSHTVRTPSTDTNLNVPLAPVRSEISRPSTPDTSSVPSIVPCASPGPVIASPTASHTGVILTWPHINGARYTVSRNDLGSVTSSPLTSALYPSTVTFTHSVPLYFHQTYRYTVQAEYGGSCGSSTVVVTAPRPAGRWAGAFLEPNSRLVDLMWEGWPGGGTPPARRAAVRVFGPAMPADGYDQQYSDCETNINRIYVCTLNIAVGPGDHAWLFVPYWETENGVMIDAGSGTRVTLTVP